MSTDAAGNICQLCGQDAATLGKLGMLDWYRCRACGYTFPEQRARRRIVRTRKTA